VRLMGVCKALASAVRALPEVSVAMKLDLTLPLAEPRRRYRMRQYMVRGMLGTSVHTLVLVIVQHAPEMPDHTADLRQACSLQLHLHDEWIHASFFDRVVMTKSIPATCSVRRSSTIVPLCRHSAWWSVPLWLMTRAPMVCCCPLQA
jgi:hypothetical protein